MRSGDGWSNSCQIESGYKWTQSIQTGYSEWAAICGNGVIDLIEEWDDRNIASGDGWSSTWSKEIGFKWDNTKQPSFWYPSWGDKIRDTSPSVEEWDDGNNMNLDGWSGSCKVEANFTCSNSTGVDIWVTKYSQPIIKNSSFDSKSLQIIIEFDQVMSKQEVTDFDIVLDIIGPNSPYSISWSTLFDNRIFKISFSSSPALLGGINERVRLQLINVLKFESEHAIAMLSPALLTFQVSNLVPSESVQSGGSGVSYMFIIIMLLSIGISIATGGSIELMWSLANTLQILYFYGVLDLYYTPELQTVFSYMKYSNFDNPWFEFIRSKTFKLMNINYTLPPGFGSLGYSSVSVIINYIDKLIMIVLFILFVLVVYIIFRKLKESKNKLGEFIKRKDIELRYEGLSRFFMEILLNMSVVILINFAYGNYKDPFDIVSCIVSIILTLVIVYLLLYCLFYPIIYYTEILERPDLHERHWFLFFWIQKRK